MRRLESPSAFERLHHLRNLPFHDAGDLPFVERMQNALGGNYWGNLDFMNAAGRLWTSVDALWLPGPDSKLIVSS
jgi:hypothetical protein